ncbi:MAG: hypothetical protein JNK15_03130 [Planctomycetes bacterium]|nr:hypothetical protein [Planctomycetota bacterium]
MPITRKQQILAKVEVAEGTSSAPGAGDAVQVFEPTISPSVDVQKRVPSGPSLSRDFDPIGRQTRTVAFKSDFRGSGSTGTAPDFERFLKATGFTASVLKQVTLGAVTGIGFQVGEIVSQSSGTIRGVVVGILTAGNAPAGLRTQTSGHKLLVAVIVGTFTAAATTGESSASTSTASAVADYASQFCYQPTSKKLVRLQTAAWSAGTIAVGNTLRIENVTTGVLLGAVQVDTLTSQTDFEVSVLWLQNGGWDATAATNRLRAPNGTDTTTLSAAPVMTKTPSLTLRHNLDGRLRETVGARGDFTLEGDAGGPMQFSWSFTGDTVPPVDAAPVATTGLSTVRPPRLLGAYCGFGLGTEMHQLPLKRVSLSLAGQVNPNLDANRSGGATGSNVTDREPALAVTVDAVNGGFDWEAALSAGTVVRAAFILGTAQGNIVAIVAPLCQVHAASPGDGDGVATMEVVLAAKRILESGDDEIYVAQF